MAFLCIFEERIHPHVDSAALLGLRCRVRAQPQAAGEVQTPRTEERGLQRMLGRLVHLPDGVPAFPGQAVLGLSETYSKWLVSSGKGSEHEDPWFHVVNFVT